MNKINTGFINYLITLFALIFGLFFIHYKDKRYKFNYFSMKDLIQKLKLKQ
jgi:hypothetical protein